MQMELIDTFLDLCDTRSFNQTAERLNVTQSTVSGRIKSLEATIGARLFVRSRAGTALTTEGLRFEPHARSLRYNWRTAINATKDTALGGVTMRVGLQHDLISVDIRGLIDGFRDVFPQTAFLFEADYSGQMCSDLASGAQDIAVLYSPQRQPDLHFELLGEVGYVMVSTQVVALKDVDQDTYILGNYAPDFAQTHAALLPELTNVTLSIGQNAAMVDLLTSLGGSAYVLEHSAARLIRSGACQKVTDAQRITQPVFAGLNNRNRHRPAYRKLGQILRGHYGGTG